MCAQQGMVICSDQTELFPFPCGGCREYMADFGDFPVYLVNADGAHDVTTSFELFPRARHSQYAAIAQQTARACDATTAVDAAWQAKKRAQQQQQHHQGSGSAVHNVRDWTVDRVAQWLRDDVELREYEPVFVRHSVDGCTLLYLEDCDLQLLLGIRHPIHRRRLLLHIDRLKDRGTLCGISCVYQ